MSYNIKNDHVMVGKIKSVIEGHLSDLGSLEPATHKNADTNGNQVEPNIQHDFKQSNYFKQFSLIYNQAKQSNLSGSDDNLQLFDKVLDAVEEFRWAVHQNDYDKRNKLPPYSYSKNETMRIHIWCSRNIADIWLRGEESNSAFLDSEGGSAKGALNELEYVAVKYFYGDWRSSFFEKVICETFVSLEAYLYSLSLKERLRDLQQQTWATPVYDGAANGIFFSKREETLGNTSYSIANRCNYNWNKISRELFWYYIASLAVKYGFWIGMPLCFYLLFQYLEIPIAMGISASIPIIYIGFVFGMFLIRSIISGIRAIFLLDPPKTKYQKELDLFKRMSRTVLLFNNYFSGPKELLKQLNADSESGAVYNPVIFAILQRAIDEKNYLWGRESSNI